MITRLKICFYILLYCKHERITQFIVNRVNQHDLFYVTDKALLESVKKQLK